MITVLELRPNPNSKSNGIDKYCNALRSLFDGDEDLTILPVENYPMRKNRVLKESYEGGVLEKVLNDKRIDIVHINGFASFSVVQSLWFAKRAKKKVVYTAHWHPFGFLNHPIRARVFFALLLKPLIRRFADIVITINDEDTAFFRRFHNHVVRIPHWAERQLPALTSFKKEPAMVLFVGRVNDSNKGVEHLFHLPEGKYDIHCVGPCTGGMRSDMTSHVNIPFEDLCALYARASLLVVPSRYEAFSYAALEALTYGTPVLLSERVRIADYLNEVEGVNVFKYHDYQDFCTKVASGIGKTPDSESVLRIFSAVRVKELYRTVFHSLMR